MRSAAAVNVYREGEVWTLDGERLRIEPVPVMRLSSMLMLRDAALAGAGVTLVPRSIAWKQIAGGELLQWGSLDGPEVELWALHTSRRLASPKLKAFVDITASRYPEGSLVLAG